MHDPHREENGGEGPDATTQRRAVRERYGAIATGGADSPSSDGSAPRDCCGSGETDAGVEPSTTGCCGPVDTDSNEAYSGTLGYTDEDVAAVVEGANLGLGCGNPTAVASLQPGETVLDLGSGAGFDCFLAAREVGEMGRVIGVDVTPEMVERAREDVDRNDVSNVEFRLGAIEHLPLADATVDVVISNCVVNLSPEKPRVYREAFRVLRPGGRLSISDVVLTAPVPAELRGDPTSIASCVAGAAPADEVASMLRESGFVDVSAQITGRKPSNGSGPRE